MRLDQLLDLAVKLRHRLTAGIFKCRANASVDFLKEGFGAALGFFAPRTQHIVKLRAELIQSLLLGAFELRGMLFELPGRFTSTRQRGFKPLQLLLQSILQRSDALL